MGPSRPNDVKHYGYYTEIILRNKDGYETGRTMVSREDLERVLYYRWHINKGYANSGRVGKLHRFLLEAPRGFTVDHINRNALDNRRENLRIVTPGENGFNQGVPVNNTSGTTGVYFDQKSNTCRQWRARINIDGRRICVGRFATKEEAIKARKAKEIELYGYEPDPEG